MKNKLIQKAKEARERAYVPYSTFKVGAAVLTKSGNIYTGCNVENASYSLACCAERTAIFNAVSQGEREFQEMAVIANGKEPVSPCGACRQVMVEFFNDDVKIFLANLSNQVNETNVTQLLPFHFRLRKKED